MVLTIIFTVIIAVLTFLYIIITRKNDYWNKKNVPHLKPSFLFGNYKDHYLQRNYIGEVVQNICQQFPAEPYIGAFLGTEPTLIVQDPELIKLITTKDFPYFASRELKDFSHKETFGKSLINAVGDDWKFRRRNMAPMFTSAKLKNMFPLIEECAVDFEKYVHEIEGKPVEARLLMASYTMAAFVSCAFGIDLKNYGKKDVFKVMGEKIFDADWIRAIFMGLRKTWPSIFYGLGFRNLPIEVTKFLNKVLTDVFESRGYKPSARKDFVDSLLSLKETAEKTNDKVDDEYIIAQSLAIFIGGFETSATTVSFLLYELAKHEDIQAKVHKEIDHYLKNTEGKITYDCLTELPYLSACMDEALRMYPIIGNLTREATANHTLPSGLQIEKGLRIHIPLYHLHHNPKYFPKPEEFRPERFYGEEKQEIVPSTYLPFGDGPRKCIGKRFGKMQSLPGLITVLRNQKVLLAEGMPTKITFEPKTITTQSKCGIHLRFLPRNN